MKLFLDGLILKSAHAHGGGLDSSGGHNCYVGTCAGTYHYHRKSQNNADWIADNFGVLIFLVVAALIFFQFRKERLNSEELHGQNKETVAKKDEQHTQQTLISYQHRDKRYIKRLLIHGPSLIELYKYSGSPEVRQECRELLKKSIQLKTEQNPEYNYYKTTNLTVQNTEKYPSLAMRRKTETYLVLDGKELISIEIINDEISEGFLHPALIIEHNTILYEHVSHGKFQLADELIEITFKEFSQAWTVFNSPHHNTRWSRWLIENRNLLN